MRVCVIDFKGSRDDHLPLLQLAYNNSYHSCIQTALYEALYGHKCRSQISWFEVGKASLIGLDLVHEVMEKVQIIRDRLKTTQSYQNSYENMKRRDLEFIIEDWFS